MTTPYFFGYGSLVNRATHDYGSAHPAQISGWRRAWRHVEGRKLAFLTAVPNPGSTIDGLIAAVPNADWSALDAREAWYKRQVATNVSHNLSPATRIQIYHAPHAMHHTASAPHPILLSYIDVVIQGYLAEFGEDGVARFFKTTDGWEAPIMDDRAAPIYPRHQNLVQHQTELVDHHLDLIKARFV